MALQIYLFEPIKAVVLWVGAGVSNSSVHTYVVKPRWSIPVGFKFSDTTIARATAIHVCLS